MYNIPLYLAGLYYMQIASANLKTPKSNKVGHNTCLPNIKSLTKHTFGMVDRAVTNTFT